MNQRKPADDVFQLIKSLTKPEKRYIKIFSAKEKNSHNHIMLYNMIEKQKTYDEEALKKVLKNKKMADHLPSEKNYLYQFIMKSMRSYHDNKSVDIKLKEQLLDAYFLFDKRLYDQCIKVLTSAKKTARRYDRFFILLEILFIERNIVLERVLNNKKERLKQINIETQQVLDTVKQYTEVHDLKDALFVMTRDQYQALPDEIENKEAEVEAFAHLNHHKGLGTFKLQQLYFFSQALVNLLKGNFSGVGNFYKKQISLYKSDNDILKSEQSPYIKTVSNYLNSRLETGDFSEFPAMLKELNEFEPKSWDEEAELFQNVKHLELLFLMNSGALEEAQKLIPEIENGLVRFKTKLNKARELVFYHNIAFLYFARADHKKALEWIRRIINDETSDIRIDIQRFAHIFQLIIHFELENFDLLDYMQRQAFRKLSKDKMTPFEAICLRNIKELCMASDSDKTGRIETLKRMDSELAELKQNSSNKILGMIEVRLWVESKLRGMDFKDLM